MKIVFTGALSTGFVAEAVLEDSKAEEAVIKHLANGKMADAIEVQCPSLRNKKVKPFEGGTNFVVFDSGLSNGYSIYGPFEESEDAEDFAEDNRSEDEEWEIVVVEPNPVSSNSAMKEKIQ